MKSEKSHTISEQLNKCNDITLKLFLALCLMSDQNHHIKIASYELAEQTGIRWGDVEEGMAHLNRLGWIKCDLLANPFEKIEIQLYHQKKQIEKKSDIADQSPINDNDSKKNIENRNRSNDSESTPETKHDDKTEMTDMISMDHKKLGKLIATQFDDQDNLNLYLNYCKKYPRNIIIEAYNRTREIPDENIRKSRGALFNYLVQKFMKGNSNK